MRFISSSKALSSITERLFWWLLFLSVGALFSVSFVLDFSLYFNVVYF